MTKCQKHPTCGIFLTRGLFKDVKNYIPMCQTRNYKNTNTKYTNSQIQHMMKCQKEPKRCIFLKKGFFKDIKNDTPVCQSCFMKLTPKWSFIIKKLGQTFTIGTVDSLSENYLKRLKEQDHKKLAETLNNQRKVVWSFDYCRRVLGAVLGQFGPHSALCCYPLKLEILKVGKSKGLVFAQF